MYSFVYFFFLYPHQSHTSLVSHNPGLNLCFLDACYDEIFSVYRGHRGHQQGKSGPMKDAHMLNASRVSTVGCVELHPSLVT